jgi:hypothetical protein
MNPLMFGLFLRASGPAFASTVEQPPVASSAAQLSLVDPGLEAIDVGAQYTDWARKHRLRGPAAELACLPFVETAQFCFTHVVGDRRVYFTAADAKPPVELLKAGAGDEASAIALLTPAYVDGFAPRYFAATGEPRAHAALLFPEALEQRLGGKCVVGVPARGVLLAWIPGDLDFDKIMAVGVKRLYDSLPNAVTSVLYTFDGKNWVVWGEAVEEQEPAR